jgi:hypothetical protein
MADLATLEQQITTAIGQQETSGGTAGVGLHFNNPGALEYQPWESAYGATLSSGGRWAQFPSMEKGWEALKARVAQLVGSGASLSTLLNTYAPVKDDNPNTPQRITDIAKATGLDPNQPIQAQAANTPQTWLERWGFIIPPDVRDNAQPDQDPETIKTVEGSASGSGIWGRAAAFAVGIICLGLGILLLRQSQIIIQGATKTAASVAAAV